MGGSGIRDSAKRSVCVTREPKKNDDIEHLVFSILFGRIYPSLLRGGRREFRVRRAGHLG